MQQKKSRWIYIDLFDLLKRNRLGTATDLGKEIVTQWFALDAADRLVQRPHLCDDKIHFKQPRKHAKPEKLEA